MHIEVQGTDLSGLQNEGGGHRIQRVPPSERKGRVHTSTVTVAILDQSKPMIKVKDADLKIEWYSGTGAGGQHRNKTQNSCRITHLPTGIMVTSQTRSRQNSLFEALKEINNRVDKLVKTKYNSNIASNRKEQVGSGMRGDKIRTIRYRDNRAIDHNTRKQITADQYLRGGMNRLWPDDINPIKD
jgi:peptide chain release factor 1